MHLQHAQEKFARAHLTQLSRVIAAKMGLHFPEPRWPDLERGLRAAATAAGFAGVQPFCDALLATALSPAQIEILARHLTIGETYFFREKPAFQALREQVLPGLIQARRGRTQQLRLWSAGCCTGEEAYSSAILLHQLLPDLRDWRLTIMASDINPHFLQKARAGVYGAWSFRDVPAETRTRYFTQRENGRYEILPDLKQHVTFVPLNLADDTYPATDSNLASMDVILCRNVLMYFSPEQAARVARKLHDALVEGGWLVVGLGEASHELFADFAMVQFPGAILYQKRHDRAARTWASPWAAAAAVDNTAIDNTAIGKAAIGNAAIGKAVHSLEPVKPRAPLISHTSLPAPDTRTVEIHAPDTPAPVSSLTLYTQGRRAEAKSQALAEVAADAQDAAALALLARICADEGELDAALAWCTRALSSDSLDARTHYLHATIQQARGDHDAATQALQRTLYLDPGFVMAHFALGYLARRQGKPRMAEKHFTNLLARLQSYAPEAVLPDADGLSAGRLIEMVRAALASDNLGSLGAQSNLSSDRATRARRTRRTP